MAKARDEDAGDDALTIDIDPALIEAALAAVDSRSRRTDGRGEGEEDELGADEVIVDIPSDVGGSVAPTSAVRSVEPPRPVEPLRSGDPPPSETVEDERRLWQIRLRDHQEKVRRLEVDLARAKEARDTLDQQFRDLRQSAQRLQQEMGLVRERARKDRDDAERVGEERVLRGLLDIVDNVERGVAHAQQDPARVLAGLNMIAEQFRMLIKRLGIERIDASRGTAFDPSRHEAVLHMPTDEVEPGHVHSEVAAGFALRGRLLRPARVVVASAPRLGQ